MKAWRFRFIITITLLLTTLLLASACDSLAPDQIPPTKLPPTEPSVSGTISGLLNSYDLVTISLLRADGEELRYGTQLGNGQWEASAYDRDESEYYTITAEAEGYTTEPESYRIKIEGETAYVLENGEIGEEALHLDFHFSAE